MEATQNKSNKKLTKAKRNNTEPLKILHQNVDRIRNKIERLNHCLHEMKPDIVVISEHGLNETDLNSTRLVNYKLVSAFCRAGIMKGGVAIYKHDRVQNEVKTLNVEQSSIPLICEVSAISIQLSKKTHLHVLGIYRPPNQDKDAYLQTLQILSTLLHKWMFLNNIILIVGDFNVDSLKPSREGTLLSELLANLKPDKDKPRTY